MDDDGLDNDVLDHSESLEEFENYDSPENSFSPDILDELENLDKNDLDDQRPHHQSLRGTYRIIRTFTFFIVSEF